MLGYLWYQNFKEAIYRYYVTNPPGITLMNGVNPTAHHNCKHKRRPRKEILEEETLPRRYAGLSACFRLVFPG